MKFLIKITLVLIVLVPELSMARFSFELGDRFRVLGDKGIKNSIKRTFEVQGNVVIINGPFTMYGGGSLLNFDEKTIDIWDNIRLSSSEFTIMAKKVFIDLSQDRFILSNGKYESGNRTLYGEKIEKKSNGDIEVLNGNFSTCQHCQRDWTFFGEEINITPNEYVRMRSAYFMIRDVPIFYIPYLVFPIKKERESGLLFPKFSLNTGDGIYFQLPFFIALSKHSDLTLSPGIFGDFGFGNEFEFRSKYSKEDQLDLKHYYLSKDRFSSEIKNNQVLFFNNLSVFDEKFRFYIHLNHLSSIELFRSFNQFIRNNFINDYFGGESSLSYNSERINTDLSFYDLKNLLSPLASGNDKSLLQLKPRVRLSLKPFSLLSSKEWGNLFFDITSDFHVFNRDLNDDGLIRKYKRSRNQISLYGNLKTQSDFNLDYELNLFQTSYFSNTNASSSRVGALFKIGGKQSYFRNYFKKIFETTPSLKNENAFKLITLPELGSNTLNETESLLKRSTQFYKHIIDLGVNFYSASFYRYNDDRLSAQQISNDFSPIVNGVNDLYDFLPGFEFKFGNIVTNQLFPIQKTIFLEFKNTFQKITTNEVFQKQKNTQNIEFEKIGNINFSQGIYFPGRYSGDKTQLTRFGLDWSLIFSENLILSGAEFYFFDSKANLSSINLRGGVSNYTYDLGVVLDDRSENKNGYFSVSGVLTKELRLKYLTRRDFENNINTEDLYKLRYIPTGRCWFYELTYQETLVEDRYFFNFALNYNEKLFENLLSVF